LRRGEISAAEPDVSGTGSIWGNIQKLRSTEIDLAAAETNNKYQKGFTASERAVPSIWLA
jgi:hypothetical protein